MISRSLSLPESMRRSADIIEQVARTLQFIERHINHIAVVKSTRNTDIPIICARIVTPNSFIIGINQRDAEKGSIAAYLKFSSNIFPLSTVAFAQ